MSTPRVAPDHESRTAAPEGLSHAWAAALAGWTTWARAAGRSPRTIKLYSSYLYRLARVTPRPYAVSTEQLLGFLSTDGWAPETRRSARAAVRAFYRWAHAAGHIPADPGEGLPSVRVPPAVPRPAPEQVVAAALAEADDRTRLAVLLAYLQGMRRSEIARLHVDDVHADHIRVRGKGGQVRTVPLHPDVEAALKPALRAARKLDAGGWVFPAVWARGPHLTPLATGKPLTAAHIGKIVGTVLGPGWTTHTLRHAAATAWYAVDRDLLAVQQLLGHSKPETTQRYVRLPEDAMRSAVLGRQRASS